MLPLLVTTGHQRDRRLRGAPNAPRLGSFPHNEGVLMRTGSRLLLLLVATALFESCTSSPDESAALANAQRELDSLKAALAVAAIDTVRQPQSTPEPAAAPPPAPSSGGWTTMGNGFFYRGVRFRSEYGMTSAIGEIRNDSGQDYEGATFSLNVYDAAGSLVGVGPVVVSNIRSGQVKSFDTMFTESLDSKASIGMSFDAGY